MIQAIGQAIPVYVMSCFKLPRGFLHELSMMLVAFWWGDKGSKIGFIGNNGISYVAPSLIMV